jgi:hypothetical protein
MIEAAVIVGLLYVLYRGNVLAPLGYAAPGMAPTGLPVPTTAQAAQQGQSAITYQATGSLPIQTSPPANNAALAAQSAASVGAGAVTGATSLGSTSIAGISGAALGVALAGVGVAVTVFAILWGRHEVRLRQAHDENSAVNLGVTGFDQDVQTVNQMYNAGQIDAATAIRALQQALAQYWALVGPRIQPDRNGCANGNACGHMQGILLGGKQPCVGDIGAACCVGCAPLYYSLYAQGTEKGVNPNGVGMVTALQHGGGPSVVKTVYGSSYGAKTREAYTLQWGHP